MEKGVVTAGGWRGNRAIIWGIVFVVTMIGTAYFARHAPIPPFWKMIISVAPMLLLIPMVRAVERGQMERGNFSPALRRYNRRALLWSFSYVAALLAAVWLYRTMTPQGVLAWMIAILPALPLFIFIWSMGRYLVEETDEYLRQRTIIAALWATGLLLAVATIYGFLETFGLVPHIPGWAAVPVWAVGLGFGNLIVRKTA